MTSQTGPAWLRAGLVGRPHGLDGSFYVSKPKPQLLERGRALTIGGRELPIDTRKGTDERPIIRLGGVQDRASVEELRGEELLVSRQQAPALPEGEWWEEELEGCAVRADGRAVGVVDRLVTLPSCEALAVRRAAGGEELLVPLVADAVLSVDVARREIEIDLSFLGEA